MTGVVSFQTGVAYHVMCISNFALPPNPPFSSRLSQRGTFHLPPVGTVPFILCASLPLKPLKCIHGVTAPTPSVWVYYSNLIVKKRLGADALGHFVTVALRTMMLVQLFHAAEREIVGPQ